MSDRVQDYQEGRAAGLELALRIVREGGLEALEREVRLRKRLKTNLGVEEKVLEKATEQLKALCVQTVRIAFFSVLHDEFGFGKRRLIRAIKKTTEHAEEMLEARVDLDEALAILKDETGIREDELSWDIDIEIED